MLAGCVFPLVLITILSGAVFSACFLNTCLRYGDKVDVACFSPIANTCGPLFVHPEGIVRRTTFFALKMSKTSALRC